MKKALTFLLIILISYSCKQRPDFNRDGGVRIKIEANTGSMLREFIIPDDSIANAVIYETYKVYNDQDKPFLELYFDKLSQADPATAPGKHFKADGLAPSASVTDCKLFFEIMLAGKMDNTLAILAKRLDQFGISDPSIHKGKKAELIEVELPGNNDMERVRKLLQGSAKLEFWETYDYKDVFQKLSDLNDMLAKELYPEGTDTIIKKAEPANNGGSLKEQLAEKEKNDNTTTEDHDKSIRKNPLYVLLRPSVSSSDRDQFELMPGPAVGTALYTDTAQINKYLNKASSKKLIGNYTKFLWTYKPIDNEQKAYSLIAIKTKRDGKAPLSGNIIQDARKIFNKESGGGPQISVTMTSEASFTWAKLTEENIGRSIAIVVDDQVFSYPTVQGKIAGGVSTITGNFTNTEADDFLNVLKAGYLPIQMRIVQEDLVPPLGTK